MASPFITRLGYTAVAIVSLPFCPGFQHQSRIVSKDKVGRFGLLVASEAASSAKRRVARFAVREVTGTPAAGCGRHFFRVLDHKLQLFVGAPGTKDWAWPKDFVVFL